MSNDITRLRWLVERREMAQRLLHDLYLVLTDQSLRRKLEGSPSDCSIFGLYVGIGFSLWRSVFLIEATRETWPTILAGAEKFLGYLVQSNAMSFDREFACREWSIGFFLNGARYRLYRIREKMPEIQGTPEFLKLEAQRKTGIDDGNVQEHWDTIYSAQHAALRQFLTARGMFHDQMFIKEK